MARVLQAPKSWSIRNVHLYHDDGSVLGGKSGFPAPSLYSLLN